MKAEPLTAPRSRRSRGRLSGRRESRLEELTVALVSQSHRRRSATTGTALQRVRALAGDPHLFELAAVVTAGNQRPHSMGGRPLHHADWCLLLFGSCIRIFGSASASARALQDQVVWRDVLAAAAGLLGPEAVADVPPTGPSRDQWNYFIKRRVTTAILEALTVQQRELGVRRAHEVGLLNPDYVTSPGRYRREHVVGLDGKVFSSPLRTLDRERVDKTTGELRPVRQDTARQRYGEGGVDNHVWGTKYAIASVRSRLANHRVILGLAHFDATTTGGEGRVFTDLALDLALRTSGIHAYTADGAWRGTHLNQIQTATGCGVIAPPRRRNGKRGGIIIDGVGHAAQPLPWSRRRITREAACGGHQLWAAAGTLFEQLINAEGESEYRELTRHQTKRDTTRHKDGTVRYQFYGRYTLPCPGHPDHDWWEPLLGTAEDAKTKFNRTEYLRITPTTAKDHRRIYGMRQDTESLNAQLERAFYGQRLPAWGVHNQTTVVLLAAVAENAWARQVWYDEAQHQAQYPPDR